MIEVLKQAIEALENNRQTHLYCEDTWYSCPKHEDRCANEFEGNECNCGADEANVEIDAAIQAGKQAIAELESQEPVAWADHGVVNWIADKQFKHASLLYTHPPQHTWVGGGDLKDSNAYLTPPQRTEQNFCPRCGKRTNDIHTCTPPRNNT
jgi:hypothetical protein